MKKIFAIAAMAAMLIACGEEKPENKPNGGGNNNGGGNEEPEYVDAITIDGDMSDWAALDASKVVEATIATGEVKYAGLSKVKVYADELYINVYFEANVVDDPETADVDETQNDFQLDICLNPDNSEETGGYANVWSDAGIDFLLEGSIASAGAMLDYDPECYNWAGEVGAEGWSWDGPVVDAALGLAVGKGTWAGYEVKISRDMVPMDFADKCTLGVGLSMSWNRYGLLPNGTITEEDSAGLAPQLVINL